MATSIETIFPECNTQDVCMTQSTVGTANLVINGNLAVGGNVPFSTLGYCRQISFVSANNLSGQTFTIYGTQNGVAISETVTGPNNDTVYGALYYDTVTVISVNGAVTNVSVGTGYSGFFNLITNLNVSNYTLSLGAMIGSNQISTAVYSTLENISDNLSTFLNIVDNNIGTLFTVKSSAASNLYIYPVSPITTVPLVNQILIALNGTTSTIGNSVKLTFRQNT